MKSSLIIACLASLSFFSCTDNNTGNDKTEEYGKSLYFGKHITEEGAIDCSELKDKMDGAIEYPAKIKGEVIGTCPDYKCILKIDMGDGTTMNVKMENSAVNLPNDLDGKTAILEGKAYVDTSAVNVVNDYDSDSGRTMAETEATRNPEESLAFDAVGVIIR